MKGLKLAILAVVFLGLGAPSLAMAKQPGDGGAKNRDKMERRAGGMGDAEMYGEDKKAKKEKIKNDGKKEHVDEFLVDADEREGKIKGEREKRHEQNDSDGSSGLYKQRDMKMEQEQKELGRGSEQGQEMREQHRRKWWKFWE